MHLLLTVTPRTLGIWSISNDRVCVCRSLCLRVSNSKYTSPCHRAHLSITFVTDPPTYSRWLKLCHKNKLLLDMVAESRQALSRVEPAEDPQDSAVAADMLSSQQQSGQEMADVIQQVRNELKETLSGRLDMLNSIAAAIQRVATNPAPKPYRISDFIPSWEGSNENGEFRHLTSDLHGLTKESQCWSALRVQTRSTTAHFR